ncbi:Uncharacterized conserved protein YndB, AHSA1/START domain [Algoriphagus ornithinivorans]|uniref:Uncharacterized conserved protein YndB, AHSA1/START domain n=1 Tax=Algoriphagus ornithinivorans TaxID=226506 RepID=A0A1I5AYR8_9BACT|nr:SRPBCC domain-containing protein [Algoriphagus ornithinivorans]SFN67587.1 Uncharacterized conserved protein YndB, AHSA1/START domain [Algoriphagus ornithinivorans]
MTPKKIIISSLISAPIKKVWDYYTDPAHIINWNFADPSWHCPHAENDLRVGGRYLAKMEAKDNSFGFDFDANYIEVNLGRDFTYQFGDRLASVSFQIIDGKTEVTIAFDPETENSIELQRNGWQAILNNFKKYTEEN